MFTVNNKYCLLYKPWEEIFKVYSFNTWKNAFLLSIWSGLKIDLFVMTCYVESNFNRRTSSYVQWIPKLYECTWKLHTSSLYSSDLHVVLETYLENDQEEQRPRNWDRIYIVDISFKCVIAEKRYSSATFHNRVVQKIHMGKH